MTELLLLEQVADGNKSAKSIASALEISDKQTYVTLKKLREKNIVKLEKHKIKPSDSAHISLLLQMLSEKYNIPSLLKDSGIPIFSVLLEPSELKDIEKETGYKQSIIYTKIREARQRGLVIKKDKKLELNKKLWPRVFEFLTALKEYESVADKRIPIGSVIYHKTEEEVVFSSKEEINAEKTAFSAYESHGIKIFTVTNYYYLPKRKLTKRDILKHSLMIVNKSMDIREMIILALFYAKFRKELRIKHEILSNLDRVFAGEKVKGYPSLSEIRDRAEVYDIKV